MSVHRIAVISDTHGMLRPEVIEILHTTEQILHGGDIASRDILEKLRQISDVTAVRGNGDRALPELPEEIFFELYGKKIDMIHNKKFLSAQAEKADIIIYGHSHKFEEKNVGGRLWLNPGSCGPRRFGSPVTMAVLEIDAETGSVRTEKVELQSGRMQNTSADKQPPEFFSGDLKTIVGTVIRDLERGKSADAIARAHKISPALTAQICQIYFTHPGIDAQGILDRIEIAGR